MSDISVDVDGFASALNGMLERVNERMPDAAGAAVKEGLKAGAKEWRSGAPVMTGKYKKSIRWHILKGGRQVPTGEIGSPSMPGLPHLLEKGHARVGGGRVAARVHIEPAAEYAFALTEEALIAEIDKIL